MSNLTYLMLAFMGFSILMISASIILESKKFNQTMKRILLPIAILIIAYSIFWANKNIDNQAGFIVVLIVALPVMGIALMLLLPNKKQNIHGKV